MPKITHFRASSKKFFARALSARARTRSLPPEQTRSHKYYSPRPSQAKPASIFKYTFHISTNISSHIANKHIQHTHTIHRICIYITFILKNLKSHTALTTQKLQTHSSLKLHLPIYPLSYAKFTLLNLASFYSYDTLKI